MWADDARSPVAERARAVESVLVIVVGDDEG